MQRVSTFTSIRAVTAGTELNSKSSKHKETIC
nr:MAG TPA: hypothetical protein [Caudoviricetes sp.]